jgi:hypothetical protein
MGESLNNNEANNRSVANKGCQLVNLKKILDKIEIF